MRSPQSYHFECQYRLASAQSLHPQNLTRFESANLTGFFVNISIFMLTKGAFPQRFPINI